jgi:TRAP-type C4-dicarboxylate transport system permease small subunit
MMSNMKFNVSKICASVLWTLFLVFGLFFAVSAQVIDPGSGGQIDPATSTSGTLHLDFSISNPISGVNTLPEFIQKLLDIVMTVGIPIVAIFIIYAGFLFVKARGNEKDLQTAKDALLYALIGGAILLGAYVIAQAIQGTIDALQ